MPKLTPHVSHYLRFTEVMMHIGIDCSLQQMEEWDWFNLPFPRECEVVMMSSTEVQNTIADTFRDAMGTTLFYETLTALGVIPEIKHWKFTYEEDEDADDHEVILIFADGERIRRDERSLLQNLMWVFREKWDGLVDWNYTIDLDITDTRRRW